MLSLVDIDEHRLHMAESLVTRYCRESNMKLEVHSYTERRDALRGGGICYLCGKNRRVRAAGEGKGNCREKRLLPGNR